MNELRVLIIEDETADKERLESTFELLKGISYKHSYTWESAKAKLTNEVFDLVIVDIWIFEKDKIEGEAGDFFCLDKVLENTESKNPPIPVIVYTGQETLSTISVYLDRIIDFWEKRKVVEVNYLEFRMRKIREMFERERPSAYFIKKLRADINGVDCGIPWKTEIEEVLSAYESYGSVKDQAKAILTPLSRIADRFGFGTAFRKAFDVCIVIDAPISALLASRPHMHHSINTFLLGYYIFNLSGIDWKRITIIKDTPLKKIYDEYYKTEHDETKAFDSTWLELNAAWFAASLLHDSGMILQKYDKTIKKLHTIITDGLDITSGELIVNQIKFDQEKQNAAKNEILRASTKEIGDYIDKKLTEVNHGIASAIYLLSHCSKEVNDNKLNDRFMKTAAEAVALHNYSAADDFPNLDISFNPVSAMLVICDAFQSWNRELYAPSIFEGELLGRVDLCKLDTVKLDTGGYTLHMGIRYFTSSMLANHKQSLDQCEADLVEIIQTQVKKPIRQKIKQDIAADVKVNLNLKFYLGFKEIESYP